MSEKKLVKQARSHKSGHQTLAKSTPEQEEKAQEFEPPSTTNIIANIKGASAQDFLHLQRTLGNNATRNLIQQARTARNTRPELQGVVARSFLNKIKDRFKNPQSSPNNSGQSNSQTQPQPEKSILVTPSDILNNNELDPGFSYFVNEQDKKNGTNYMASVEFMRACVDYENDANITKDTRFISKPELLNFLTPYLGKVNGLDGTAITEIEKGAHVTNSSAIPLKVYKSALAMPRLHNGMAVDQLAKLYAEANGNKDFTGKPLPSREKYNDTNLEGEAKFLGAGDLNAVFELNYKDVSTPKVFKADTNFNSGYGRDQASAVKAGIPEANPQFARRNVAMYKLNNLFAGDVIPETDFAVFSGHAGTVMDKAEGKPLGSLYNIQDRLEEQPAYQRALSQLRILDVIAGQVDRHLGNIIVDADENGTFRGLKGIDNDMAFGKDHKKNNEFQKGINPDEKFNLDMGRNSKALAEIREIDPVFVKRLENVEGERLKEVLQDLLSPEEVAATLHRFFMVKKFLRTKLNDEETKKEYFRDFSELNKQRKRNRRVNSSDKPTPDLFN